MENAEHLQSPEEARERPFRLNLQWNETFVLGQTSTYMENMQLRVNSSDVNDRQPSIPNVLDQPGATCHQRYRVRFGDDRPCRRLFVAAGSDPARGPCTPIILPALDGSSTGQTLIIALGLAYHSIVQIVFWRITALLS